MGLYRHSSGWLDLEVAENQEDERDEVLDAVDAAGALGEGAHRGADRLDAAVTAQVLAARGQAVARCGTAREPA